MGLTTFEVVLTSGLRFHVTVESEAALKNLILSDSMLPARVNAETDGGWRIYAAHVTAYREVTGG
jgi:hypothetical protein